jgi:ubiquinone/menaquinone biosynthesis C-methylase UbiE
VNSSEWRAGKQCLGGFRSKSQSAEDPLPLSDASVDTVVSTWTLCSVLNALEALRQMKRVLKPDGRFMFIEHGRAPELGVVAWQDRLTPTWKRVSGGCHLNRKVDELIKTGGFQITQLKPSIFPGRGPLRTLTGA